MKSLKCIFHMLDLYMPPAQQEENKQNSKDEAIIVVEEEEENNKDSKEENPLIEEGIKDELKEETHVVLRYRTGE